MIKVIYFSSFVCSVDFADSYDSEVKYMELENGGPLGLLTLSFAPSKPKRHRYSGHIAIIGALFVSYTKNILPPVDLVSISFAVSVEGGGVGDSSSWIY